MGVHRLQVAEDTEVVDMVVLLQHTVESLEDLLSEPHLQDHLLGPIRSA